MPEKKSYSAPQLVRVELNHEQAILSTCVVGTTNASVPSTSKCKASCKQGASGGNSAARAS